MRLLRIVRAVAEIADPKEPAAVSQRMERARSASQYADAPLARTVSRRLGVSWPRALELAFVSARQGRNRLSTQRTGLATWLTEEHAIEAVRLIAQRLGSARITQSEYQ